MGRLVLNSFSDGGRFLGDDQAEKWGLSQIEPVLTRIKTLG